MIDGRPKTAWGGCWYFYYLKDTFTKEFIAARHGGMDNLDYMQMVTAQQKAIVS